MLASYSAMEKNRAVLQNRLENRGYFKDTVMLDTDIQRKKTERGIHRHDRDSNIPSEILFILTVPDTLSSGNRRGWQARSLLKKGDAYNLDVIKNERTRIDTRLKQRGYYYFSPDDLLIRADSSVGDHQVDMTLIVKKSTPQEAYKIYRIKDVVVFADYNVHVDTSIDVSAIAQIPWIYDY